MSHWTGSVSWNSSTSTTLQRARSRSATASPPGAASVLLQAREQVVVAHDRHPALALVELLAHGLGEAPPHLRGLALRRDDRCGRVLDRDARNLGCLRAGERRRVACVEAAHVEVVDDLLDEVARVFDERRVGVDVAGDPEAREDLLAEAVRRSDRRGVEVGERLGEVVSPCSYVFCCARGEQRHDLVGAGGDAGEHPTELVLDAHEPLAHTLTQLAGRHAGERDEQQLLQREAVRDIARRERGDRVGLARPGARLEHGHAGRQGAADVERLGVGVARRHDPNSSCASSPAHMRRA